MTGSGAMAAAPTAPLALESSAVRPKAARRTRTGRRWIWASPQRLEKRWSSS
ncbi:unnamed protein product [Effrenium voratum]|nr:unnamed protein product [Effrenium voratum]